MEISWEVTSIPSQTYLKHATGICLKSDALSMPSASSIQRMERTPPEVSGLVEEERLQRGVEERNHQMVKVLHL